MLTLASQLQVRIEMALTFVLFAILCTFGAHGDSASVIGNSEDNCPRWMAFEDGKCTCRPLPKFNRLVLYCNSTTDEMNVAAGVCLSLLNVSGSKAVVVGDCPYVPLKNKSYDYYDFEFYRKLPSNESQLEDVMCGPFKRQNLLCSSCRPGYGISVYSFGHPCAKCDSNHLGVLWYILLESVPMCVLYVIVVLFSIRATSAPLAGLVFFSHVILTTVRGRIIVYTFIAYSTNRPTYVLLEMVLSLCGIWNLDFFPTLITPFCVSERIVTLYAVFLEYMSALYPLILVFISFVVIELHAHNVRPVVWMWKPFHKWFVHLRRTWNIKRSIINAFSTFLLLSYSKMIFVSFRLLHRTSTFDINGTSTIQSWQFEPNMAYFGRQHVFFGLFAIILIVVFTVPPILLLVLYPTRLFQKSLQYCHCRAVFTVHMFVDTYQGCFKDGTNGTRDYRALSVVYLVLRFVLLSLYIQHTDVSDSGWILIAFVILFMLMSLLLALLRPYKANYMTYCESAMLFLLGIVTLLTYILLFNLDYNKFVGTAIVLVCVPPHLALIGYVVYIVIRGHVVIQWLKKQGIQYTRHCEKLVRTFRINYSTSNINEESLPDRFINADAYFQNVSYQLENTSV